MRLVFAGTPEVALPSLDAIAASSHDLVAVVTRPDAVAGRGRWMRRSPVATWADAHGIEVLTPDKPGDPAFRGQLAQFAPDIVPVVAYGALVPAEALTIPRLGWINLHFSLLPQWRGAAPVQHAVWHGDQVTGASVFQLEAGLDTGPVFGTVAEHIAPTDTTGTLLERLSLAGAGLLTRVLDAIEAGAIEAAPQSGEASSAPKITVDDAEVRWDEPAFAVDRRVRACTPDPGAWSTLRGDRVKLGPVAMSSGQPRLDPGVIRVLKSQVLVGTATDPVVLGEVRAAGKKAMSAADWARGARLADGESFTRAAAAS